MGSIFQDKAGYWRGTVNLPRIPGGSRKQKTFYGDLSQTVSQQKKELQIQITNLEYEINNNLYLNESNATMEQYLKEWLKIYAAENLEETTGELYEMYVEVHINPILGKLKIKEIKPMQIQEFYNEKMKDIELKNGKVKKGLSKNTIGKLHSFLNRAFDDAMKNRKIKYNPCQGVNKPKKKKYKPTICSEENFYTLLDKTKGTFDEIMILLSGICGLRRGEIFGLRFIDVDSKNYKISIMQTKVRFKKKWIIKEPKNDTSARKISVPEFVTDTISTYLASLKVVPETIFEEFLPDAYSKHFSKLLITHNIPHIRFHDLRHFNAIIMLKYGVTDKVASGRLGHSRVQTTREIYQHVLPDMDKQASNIIEGIFSKKSESN
jgi:integrase